MRTLRRHSQILRTVFFIIMSISLVLGSGAGIISADLLSGAETTTLVREPQQTPNGLGAAGFDGLQFADPAAQIDLVQPPVANNQGDAQLSHPLSVPAGRAGLQPKLVLAYSSAGGNGWVGQGWDLSVGEVTIDTRWGVPRYNTGDESETYLLDGEQLAPTAVRSALLPREADRVFTRRVEGEFERIVRHGAGPGSYWWEVTDKSGAHRFYGGTPEGGRDASAILGDDNGNGFTWALTQIRDISNNTMTFTYDVVTGRGVGEKSENLGRDLYLNAIKYTGTVAAGLTDDPAYEVKFLRDSDLSESLRPDISIDATGGFLRVTSDLLRRVEVYHRAELVHRYELNYAVEAFDKTFLQSVDQAGADGATFATHTFDYFDDVRKGATYHGFATSENWDTKDDNVTAGLDPGEFGDDAASALAASALGGAELIGGGGRAYIGYNQFKPGKGGSFGGGFVLGADGGHSRLELLDINGDNLPDKVFEESGAVKYRLNTSGPDGGTTFGDKHTVANLDNLSREKSDFFSVGPEAYAAISLMYNHAWSKALGRAYFIDVNTDGLVDFVQNGEVSFNSLDSNGNPEFIANSSGTGLEIDPGTFDPSLVPDTSAVEAAQREQAPLQDTLRRWRAPWSGTVTIQGNVQLLPPTGADPVVGDGVRVAIQHNGSELWSTDIAGGDYTAKTPTFADPNIVVNRGDKLYFRVQSIDDGASDEVSWDPLITYSNETILDANGLDIYHYQASEDFTLAGRSGIHTAVPMTGTLRVTGVLTKTRKTTDDITIQVLKNGTLVGSSTIARTQTGVIPFMTDFSVIGGDDVLLRLKIDSPVDLSAFSWTSSLSYLSATQDGQPVTVIDSNGDPISLLNNPPVDIQIYPGNDLVAPQVTWTAPVTATVTVKPVIAFDLCSPSSPSLDCSNDGTVVVTVKKKITPSAGNPPAERVAKHTIQVTDGVPASGLDFPLSIEKDAEYWFDLSVAQPALGMDWQSASISVQFTPEPTVSVPSARHWAFIPEDVFPMPHRGWGVAGYNGDGDLATAPIVENNLLFDEDDYPTSDPKLVSGDPDHPTYKDVDPAYKNPVHGKSYAYMPHVAIDETTSIVTRQWRGSKANLFGSATGAGSSRIGPDSIGFPDVSTSGDVRAVSRFSMTEADAVAVTVVIGGSRAWGSSKGRLDFFDMNGDQFPDIIGNGGVQYTTARGGLESNKTTLPNLSDSEDHTTSYTVDLGGTPAKITANSKGDGNTPQDAAASAAKDERSSSSNGDTGAAESGDEGQSVELGLSGSLGGSSTNKEADSPTSNLIESELADINGDGLPDLIRVYKDPSPHMTVSFNLGYRFDSNEIDWPGASFEEGDSFSYGVGASLGFTTGKREFSGGSSFNTSTEKSLATWVDMNGDGLLDQVISEDDTINVRFGTGAGLTGPVDWGDFIDDEIASSKSQSIGVGFDFTISIGPLCLAGCYIIVNPGADGEGGMSRQELELNDVNGDGYPDHIASTSDELMKVALNTTGRTNLLKSVSNPLGGSITLDYTRKGNTTSQAFSQWVMSSVAVDDGRAGDGPDVRLTTYEYADNVYDPVERDFLGYATVIEHQHNTAVTDNPVLRSFERVYRNGNIFDTGLLKRVTSLDTDDNAIEETVKEWGFVKTGTTDPADLSVGGVALLPMSVFPQQVKSEYHRYSDGSVIKNTYSTFVYDVLGNVISSTDVGEPALPDDDVVATFTYTACTADSWVSIPQTFTVRDGSGSTVLRSRWAENGGNEMCDNGVVTTLYEDTGSGIAQTDLGFDAWGNYNQITYPANENGERYQVNYVYDPDRRTSIAEVTDSFGLVARATYHDPTGQIASQTDANGQTTSYTYDPQGRPASITGPYEQGTGNATVTFEYFPTAPDYAYGLAHNYDAFNPSDTIDTVSFLDGIGRKTQTKQDATLFRGAGSTAQDVMVVSGAVEFDALGRAVREWYPIEEPLGTIGVYNLNTDDVAPTLFAYDVEDRITQIERPSGATTTTAYGYDDASRFNTTMYLTTRTDPLGNARRAYTDVRDNVLAVEVDHEPGPTVFTEQVFLPLVSGGSINAAAPPATAQPETVATAAVVTLRTSFIYDPLQQLVQTIDPAGNETRHEYDLLGRRTATTTPDGGRVEMVYDLASQVIAKITPNLRTAGGQISYDYDHNRLVGISYTDGTPNVIYTYGDTTAMNNGIGRIVQVEDGARIQLRSFGPLGEVVEDTTTMLVHNLDERFTWTTASTFDSWGRPKTVTYPDGEVVTHDYDSGGFMSSMAGLKGGIAYPYVNRLEYDKFFARRFTETGNSVATETQYDLFTRRLSRRIVDAPGRRVQDIAYEYDSVGNVLNADNAAPSPVPDLMGGTSQQVFAYDDLYRLISATGSYDFAPEKRRDYTYDVAYDTLGNIVGKIQTDSVDEIPQLKTTYNQSYRYTAAPHQPTLIGHRSYTYDANGNLTGWTDDDSGENRTVTWDAEERVTSVADQGSTTRYTYNDEDRLAIERGPLGETSFVNRFYTVRNGVVSWKHFWAGTERIATKRQMPVGENEDMRYFFHKDLLGSTNLITDPNGQVFEHLEYFPSGETWVLEHSDIYRTPYLYAGGYLDEFRQIYNFGARWYEPRDQMFYSPDPSLATSPTAPINDPALLAAYSYAENNPLRLVDRDGLAPEDAQNDAAGAAAFARPNGAHDTPKARRIRALVQQEANDQPSADISRLDAKPAGQKHGTKTSKFKAFATFEAKPVVEINLTKTSDGYKVKDVKVAPFLFKQYTVKKGEE